MDSGERPVERGDPDGLSSVELRPQEGIVSDGCRELGVWFF